MTEHKKAENGCLSTFMKFIIGFFLIGAGMNVATEVHIIAGAPIFMFGCLFVANALFGFGD